MFIMWVVLDIWIEFFFLVGIFVKIWFGSFIFIFWDILIVLLCG